MIEARDVADGCVEPHIKIFTGCVGDFKPKVGSISANVPALQARIEPLSEFIGNLGL